MSIQCYLKNGIFTDQQLTDLNEVSNSLEDTLHQAPIELLVDLLSRFGKALTRSPLIAEEGVFYLASWLRASNLRHYLTINLGNQNYLDSFIATDQGIKMRAQPRGLVCHWIAGNVPTLALFSLFQSILAKNTNILRIPKECVQEVKELLALLEPIKVERDGISLSGADVLKTISILYFESSNRPLNEQFSMMADCKVVWGGKEAVSSVLALPQAEHCEAIVFGPKYSFAVMDQANITQDNAQKLANDIYTFDQNACTSPHVIFCENETMDGKAATQLADEMASAFSELSKKFPKGMGSYNHILNARGIYWLDPDKNIRASKGLDWTVLQNNQIQLEEPLGDRTIFVKEVRQITDALPLITKKIQTIGIALENDTKKLEFCNRATQLGASRCVNLGSMNDYQTPWDGILFINRLVRWVSMQ